jgi:hypothetical protein
MTTNFNAKYDASEAFEEQVQRLLDRTWKGKSTRDRDGKIPKRLKVMNVKRIESRDLWVSYTKGRERVRSSRGRCTPVNALDGDDDETTGIVCTYEHLDEQFKDRLDESVNEHYLFHGTSPEGAIGITQNGFNLGLTGTSAGTAFGNGAYFAERSSKSDEYARAGAGIYDDAYALLLSRVCCGEMFRVLKSDHEAINSAIRSTKYDSVLADREASVGTYREFVVFSEDLIYPEYIILYKRQYED